MTEGRRLRRVGIMPEVMIEWMTTGWRASPTEYVECVEGLPVGAKCIRFDYDLVSDVAYMLVEHESFELVQHGEVIPKMHVTYCTTRLEESES